MPGHPQVGQLCHNAAWTWKRVPLWSASSSESRCKGPGRCMTWSVEGISLGVVGCSGGFWGVPSDRRLTPARSGSKFASMVTIQSSPPPFILRFLGIPSWYHRKSLLHILRYSILFLSLYDSCCSSRLQPHPPNHCLFAWLRRSQSSNTASAQTTPVTPTVTLTPSISRKAISDPCVKVIDVFYLNPSVIHLGDCHLCILSSITIALQSDNLRPVPDLDLGPSILDDCTT